MAESSSPSGGGNAVEPEWLLVGNIVKERPYGPEGAEFRPGTKHFSAGTKVYCLPPQWGDGYEQIKVIGRHRGSKRYVTMIISSAWVENWRAKLVYSPEVLRRADGRCFRSEAVARSLADSLNSRSNGRNLHDS